MLIVKSMLFLLLLGFFQPVFSQTKLIAHKSHSGKKSQLELLSTEDNFGLPSKSQSIKRVTRLDAHTVVIEYYYYQEDTVKDHKVFSNPAVSLDSLKAGYDEHVEFIGFDKSFPDTNPDQRKKKKQEFFLGFFLWDIPGAGILLLITILSAMIGGIAYYHWKWREDKLRAIPLLNRK